MHIHLDKSTRFYRDVYVDGVLYGHIEASHRGMHGVRYLLLDSTVEYVTEKKHADSRYPERYALGAWSDKQWLRHNGFYGSVPYAIREAKARGKFEPLDKRIAFAVEDAIKRKLLLSPGQIAEQMERDRKRDEEHRAEHAKKERDAFDARAAKAVESLPEKYRQKMIAPILEAMEWAKSR